MTEAQRTGLPGSDRRGCRVPAAATVLPAAVEIPAEAPMRLHDWVFLNVEDRVVVQLPDERVFAGIIDAVATDASVFWLWVDGGGGRTAVHEEEGCKVWKSQNWLGITSCEFLA